MAVATLLPTPSATTSGETHTDWLELTALTSPRRAGSAEDLIGALRASGVTDALVEEALDDEDVDIDAATDQGSERAQALAESALALADERSRSVLRPQRYPFDPRGRSLVARPGAASSTYTYLLLLTHYGESAGPAGENGAELFESVAAVAARNYFGGDSTGAVVYQFGFPHRNAPAGFADAVDDMCMRMNEGGGARRERPTIGHQKDGKLDLAAWIPMPDQRYGKVLGFGQCATGRNWPAKVSELQASTWCSTWMLEVPPAIPLPLFFLPHRISATEWTDRAPYAGVMFDRCRLTAYAARVPSTLRARIARWNAHVLAERLGA